MSDTWVLSSVLEPKEDLAAIGSSGQETGSAHHRRLLKQLDAESALVTTFEPPDTWRTRFRERKIEFHMPRPRCVDKRVSYNPIIMSVNLCDTADFVILMINEHPSPDQVSTLIFYRLGLSGQPLYVGQTQYSNPRISSPVPRIQDMATGRICGVWLIEHNIGLENTCHWVKSSNAFANGDEEFQLWPLTVTKTIGDEKNTVNARIESLNSVSKVWQCLACLPDVSVSVSADRSNRGLVQLSPLENAGRCTRKLVVAKHIETEGIFLLGINHPMHMYDDGVRNASSLPREQISENLWKVVALLSPKQGWCFRNLTVAPYLVGNCHALIGIIWQETDSEDSRPELYHYNVCRTSSGDNLYAESVVSPDSAAESYDEAPASGNSQSYISIQGKRIASMTPQMGGIHSSSPLHDPETRFHKEEDPISGLQIFRDHNHRSHRERSREDVLNEKIIVWGRSEKGDSHITLRIFYLSFADPSQLRSYQNARSWIGTNTSPYRNNFCACPLHDDGFRVMLPDTSCEPLSCHPAYSPFRPRPTSRPESIFKPKSIFRLKSILSPLMSSLRKQKSPTVASAPKGSVEHIDPPARQEALEREMGFFKEIIKAMKGCGMSNESIETEWSGARMTDRGKIPKPNGWRDF